MKDIFAYLRALWKQWVVLLTGGAIMAMVAFFGFASGQPLPRLVGLVVLGVTLVIASFVAWRDEYRVARSILDHRPRMFVEVVEWHRQGFALQSGVSSHDSVNVRPRVRIANPTSRAISMDTEWALDIYDQTGKRVESLTSRTSRSIQVINPGGQSIFTLSFLGDADRLSPVVLGRASFVVRGADIHGQDVAANYPSERGRKVLNA